MGIEFRTHGDWDKTRHWMEGMLRGDEFRGLQSYGQRGVDALSSYTPRDTGLTAESWGYRIVRDKTNPRIEWFNSNVQNGSIIAILIQYGHGTGTGGYVEGRDYINPAIQPVFDQIANEVWKEMTA